MIKWFIVHVIVIAALIGGLFALTKIPRTETERNGTVVYLVRHAEKITGENAGRDPARSEERRVGNGC